MKFKKIFQILAILFLGALGGIFWQGAALPFFSQQPALRNLWFIEEFRNQEVNVFPKEEIIIQDNQAVIKAVTRVEKSVVGIKTVTSQGATLEGSGMILTADGKIVTLADLLPAGSKTFLYLDGQSVDFELVKTDFNKNLALLKVARSGLSTTGFADLGQLNRGTRVFFVGTIFVEEKPTLVVNEGIVKYFGSGFIRTNIFEAKSLKGSGLFNVEGNLLGLNLVDFEGKVTAIPIDIIRQFAEL